MAVCPVDVSRALEDEALDELVESQRHNCRYGDARKFSLGSCPSECS